MWISRISLRNFKSYRNQTFEFPQPADGQNLVLIGGVNGYGKTTLLEAVYVGLYGEEAVTQQALDRAGLKARGYGHFLENAFYKHALSNGEDRMEVIIEITHPDRGQLRITRKWFFKNKGQYDNQRLIIEELPKKVGHGEANLMTSCQPCWRAMQYLLGSRLFSFLTVKRLLCWLMRIVPAGFFLAWKVCRV